MGIPKITEMAINSALSGGGKRGGTAIPAGVAVDRIYFNTNNTREETNAILSQLTYVEGIMEYPIALIYACVDGNYEGDFFFAIKSGELYGIIQQRTLTNDTTTLFVGIDDVEHFNNGWLKLNNNYGTDGGTNYYCVQFAELHKKGQPLADFMGFPIGTENEKIKNVLSITPF